MNLTMEGREVIESIVEDLRILHKKALAEKRELGDPKDRGALRTVEDAIADAINRCEDLLS